MVIRGSHSHRGTHGDRGYTCSWRVHMVMGVNMLLGGTRVHA